MILLKSARELERMRQAGKILAEVKDRLRALVRAGITTREIDVDVEAFIISRNARSATQYFGIPADRVVELGMQIDL